MTLNINPPNFSGMPSAGGVGNLANPGALGLQALQLSQEEQASLRDAAIKQAMLQQQANEAAGQQFNQRQQIQQQGLLGQKELDYKNRVLAQQGLLGQGELGLKQQELQGELEYKNQLLGQQGQLGQQEQATKQQNLMVEAAKLELDKLKEEKKETLQEKGAFAVSARMAMDQVKTPEEANILRNEIINEAATKKYISPEEVKTASTLPLSQFKSLLDYKIVQYDAAKDYKTMKDEDKKSSPSGQTIIKRPDGTEIVLNDPTKPIEGQFQKELVSAEDNLKEIKSLYENVPEEFFGAKALKPTVTAVREWAEGIPGIGGLVAPSEEDKAQLEKFSSFQAQSKRLALDTIRQISGLAYTDAQFDFLKDVIPEIGSGEVKSVFDGKAKNLIRYLEQIKSYRKDLLKDGIDVGTPQYEEKMVNKMKEGVKSNKFEGLKRHLKEKGHSDAEINSAIEALGILG